MNLFFLRHGIAVEYGASGAARDSARPLSEEGLAKTREIVGAVKKMDFSFDAILSSPYARARQTAEIAAEVLGFSKKIQFTVNLTPQGTSRKLVDELNDKYGALENILLVGHEPQLSSLIGLMISGSEGAEITLKKAGFCKVSADNLKFKQCASLEFLLTPTQLIRISKS